MKNVADQIGTLRAQIAVLKDDLKVLEDSVKFNAPITLEGELFDVVGVKYNKKSTPWKAIANKFGTPLQIKRAVKSMSKTSLVGKVTCTAKVKSRKAA